MQIYPTLKNTSLPKQIRIQFCNTHPKCTTKSNQPNKLRYYIYPSMYLWKWVIIYLLLCIKGFINCLRLILGFATTTFWWGVFIYTFLCSLPVETLPLKCVCMVRYSFLSVFYVLVLYFFFKYQCYIFAKCPLRDIFTPSLICFRYPQRLIYNTHQLEENIAASPSSYATYDYWPVSHVRSSSSLSTNISFFIF